MSENNGGPRPDGRYQPGNGGDPSQQPWQQGAGSANQAPQQWSGQDTGQFPASSTPDAGQYGQGPYNPNATQQFQPQNSQDQYGHTQAFGAPQGGQYNQGQGQGYGQFDQGQSGGGGQFGGGGYGQPPGNGIYGQPPEKGRNKLIAWIVLGVVLLVAVVVGILFATGVFGGEGDDGAESRESTRETATETETATEPEPDPSTSDLPTLPGEDPTTDSVSAGAYGSDRELDMLYDQCQSGMMASCDELFISSPVGSEYEEFAMTCGGTTTDRYSWCDDATGSGSGTDSGSSSGGTDSGSGSSGSDSGTGSSGSGSSADGNPSRDDVKAGMAAMLESYGIDPDLLTAAGISTQQLDNYYTCVVDTIWDETSVATLQAIADQNESAPMSASESTAFMNAIESCVGELGL